MKGKVEAGVGLPGKAMAVLQNALETGLIQGFEFILITKYFGYL